MAPKFEKPRRIGDGAVRAATGKRWEEWFSLLDTDGGRGMSHQEIVACLTGKHKVSGWWGQMVTVSYEQDRRLRKPIEGPHGFRVTVSRTIAAPLEELYKAWEDADVRRRWLPDAALTVRKARPGKSMRITWIDGETNLDVNFYSKEDARSQVSVEHGKLPDGKTAARMKLYWSEALDRLNRSFT